MRAFATPLSRRYVDWNSCDPKGSLQAATRAAGCAIYGVDKGMSQIGPIMGSHIRAVSERVRVCAPAGPSRGNGRFADDGLVLRVLYLQQRDDCRDARAGNLSGNCQENCHCGYWFVIWRGGERVDIHHGNGTEQILRKFNHPEKILFWSSHIFFHVCVTAFHSIAGPPPRIRVLPRHGQGRLLHDEHLQPTHAAPVGNRTVAVAWRRES